MKRFFRLGLFSVLCLLSSVAFASDLSITSGSVAKSVAGKSFIRKAAESITKGQVVYLSTSDNKFHLCDNNASLAASKAIGIAIESGSADDRIKVCVSDPKFKVGATLVIGDRLYTSGTAGGITKTDADNVTGMYVTCLGVAVSTTEFKLNITRADAVKP